MKYKFVRLDGAPWPAQNGDMLKKLDMPEASKLPEEGIPPRMVDGIKVWVTPANPKKNLALGIRKSSVHRVLCECPGCGRVVSAGRLAQHKCSSEPPRGSRRRK